MSETEKPEDKPEEKTEEKKKKRISSKVNTPVQAEGAEQKTSPPKQAAPSEIPSKGPKQHASVKPRGDGGAEADALHAPSKQPPAAAKAAAPAAAKAAAPKATGTLRIRQIKSGICTPLDQKQTLLGLGLRRIRHEVVRPDTPAVRGQILKVRHLVEIVESGTAR